MLGLLSLAARGSRSCQPRQPSSPCGAFSLPPRPPSRPVSCARRGARSNHSFFPKQRLSQADSALLHRGPPPAFEQFKAEVAAGRSFVRPLPARPLDVVLAPSARALVGAKLTVAKDLPNAPVLRAQMASLRAHFAADVNLDREGGRQKESTLDTLDRHVRRLLGFLHAGFGVPLDLRYAANGEFIAQYVGLLLLRKVPDSASSTTGHEKNYAYICTALIQASLFSPSLARRQTKTEGCERGWLMHMS